MIPSDETSKSRVVQVATFVVVAAVVLVIGVTIMQSLATGQLEKQMEMSEAYCNQELGEENYTLVNSRVIGGHGGLHCDAEDGTLIHIHEVSEEDLEEAWRKENGQ